MPRLLCVLLMAGFLSFLPSIAHAAPLGRVPLADSTTNFDGYYGYDGKYHRPNVPVRPRSPLDVIWRSPSTSRYGSTYGYWGR